jgi:hypothetical protein
MKKQEKNGGYMMKVEFSRELGDLFSHNCFFISPLNEVDLRLEFAKYKDESKLTDELKEQLRLARLRRKNKNIMSNYKENTLIMMSDIVKKILKERGINNDITANE